MDADFFAKLDRVITGVGVDKVWKKTILGREVWFSPIDVTRQTKVMETIQNPELGTAAWEDAKRVSLAAAVVGIDDVDFRPARDAGPIFTIPGRDGQPKKVDLSTYIYHKVAGWDSDFFDVAYDVFVDLMQTHRKNCRKDVTFENAKDPREELLEIEQRAAELRDRLGLPPLVEASSEAAPTREDAERRDRLESDEPLDSSVGDFNPFAPVSAATAASPAPPPPRAAAVPAAPVQEETFEPPVVYGTAPTAAADPRVVQAMRDGRVAYSGEHELPDNAFAAVQSPGPAVPVPIVEVESDEAKMTPIQREMARQGRRFPVPVSTVGQGRRVNAVPNPHDPTRPLYVAGAGNSSDVVETPAQRIQASPPVVNPSVASMNKNPRFSRPVR